MGALTSKPYAFTARPWELKSLKATDCFDSFGSSLRIDVRGLDVMRVLPRVNDSVNEEWITDRIRFSYDGLKCQRITQPLKLISTSLNYSRLDWSETFLSLFNILILSGVSNFNVFIGKLQTFNSFYSTLSFFNKLLSLRSTNNLNILYNESLNSYFDISYRTNYLLNNLDSYKNSDLIFFINTNLRVESPILNIRLRRLVLSRSVPVFSWGVYSDQTYTTIFIGNSMSHLANLVGGRHPLAKILLKSKSPLLLSSKNSYNSYFLSTFIKTLYNTLNKFVTNVSNSYISSTTSSLMVFDYGLISKKIYVDNDANKNLLWISSDDDIVASKHYYKNIIYCGHHGDRNALNADLILPTPFLFEERTPIMNLLGLLENTEMVLNPPTKARNTFSIFNSFFLILNDILNLSYTYNVQNVLNVRPYINLFLGFRFSRGDSKSHNSIKLLPFILPDASSLQSHVFVDDELSSSYSFSYYSSNVVLRSSYVMALSKVRFQQYDNNFKN